MTERSTCAEGVVGEASVLLGLRRAICQGLDKVTIQAVLIAAVQNLKRLAQTKAHRLREKMNLA